MNEKYEVRVTDGEYLREVANTETDVIEGFSGPDGAIGLCAKLNRLAALEAVCREIVDNAALEKHSSSFSTAFLKGSEVTERHIAQKLKAVLEEA